MLWLVHTPILSIVDKQDSSILFVCLVMLFLFVFVVVVVGVFGGEELRQGFSV